MSTVRRTKEEDCLFRKPLWSCRRGRSQLPVPTSGSIDTRSRLLWMVAIVEFATMLLVMNSKMTAELLMPDWIML